MRNASSSLATTALTITESRAFREAALRSETQRAYAVMAVTAVIPLVVLLARAGRDVDIRIKMAALLGVACLFVLQICVLILVRWARGGGRGLPPPFVVATVVVESLLPAALILWNIMCGSLAPYAALSAPPVLVYGLLIGLTTLRLSPALCILAGAVSAASYGGVLAYVTYGLGLSVPTTGLPYASYLASVILIFACGCAGAWVASEIRRHLHAALGEAELHHRMDRMERDLSVAQSIQQALLPRSAPEVPGFDIAGWSRSADETGGDYYDWQALADGNWMVTLADVSGHGIGPALVTAACRAYVRASSQYESDLASLASRMNALLAADLPEGRFVTMVTVLIDRSGGPLRLLSAGHGPIVLYIGATGKVEDIMPGDPPLAVVPGASFGPAQAVALAPGDVLALVTDGFVEWAIDGGGGAGGGAGEDRREQFGMPRLRESLARHAGMSAAEIIRSVAADVDAFARGEPQQDDLTMIVIKRAAAS